MNSQYEAKLKAVCNQCSLAQWHSLVKGEVALGMRDSLRLAFVAGARAALERHHEWGDSLEDLLAELDQKRLPFADSGRNLEKAEEKI